MLISKSSKEDARAAKRRVNGMREARRAPRPGTASDGGYDDDDFVLDGVELAKAKLTLPPPSFDVFKVKKKSGKGIEGKIMPVLFASNTGCSFSLWTFNTVCQN